MDTKFVNYIATASWAPPEGMAVAAKNELHRAQGLAENDLLYVSVPLIHEGPNDNGDEFTSAEMKKSYKSMIGTPLDLNHSFSVEHIIGKNYNANYETVDGFGIITVDSYIYANYHPDIASKIMDGVINAMSMEVHFQSALRRNDGKRSIRTLVDCTFLGSGLVRIPGNPKALISDVRSVKASKDEYKELELELAMAIAIAMSVSNEKQRV